MIKVRPVTDFMGRPPIHDAEKLAQVVEPSFRVHSVREALAEAHIVPPNTETVIQDLREKCAQLRRGLERNTPGAAALREELQDTESRLNTIIDSKLEALHKKWDRLQAEKKKLAEQFQLHQSEQLKRALQNIDSLIEETEGQIDRLRELRKAA